MLTISSSLDPTFAKKKKKKKKKQKNKNKKISFLDPPFWHTAPDIPEQNNVEYPLPGFAMFEKRLCYGNNCFLLKFSCEDYHLSVFKKYRSPSCVTFVFKAL